MSFIKEIYYRLSKLSISGKIIIINVGLFLFVRLLVFFFQLPQNFLVEWFELPGNFPQFFRQPWSILTYSFFHGGFFHLFWNVLWLYFSSTVFLYFFSANRFIKVYLVGAVAGGLLFLLSYQVFPVFYQVHTTLIGASAAIMAILIASCSYMPQHEVRAIFFNVKLWHIAVFFVLIDLIQLPINNSGGHIAHLGGALWGFAYGWNLRRGNDIKIDMERIMRKNKPTIRTGKKQLQTVYKKKSTTNETSPDNLVDMQRQIDVILDKISKSGYESLSKEEKDFLFKASKN